jgi:large subunit ribosomal protein L23
VEGLFEVDVEQVQVLNVKGKQKSFRLVPGRQKGWKKAYVRVKSGQTIEEVQAD